MAQTHKALIKSTFLLPLHAYIGLDVHKIRDCMGDPEADADNEVLKGEQDAQASLHFVIALKKWFLWPFV